MDTEKNDQKATKNSPRRLFELMAGKNPVSELSDEYYDSVLHGFGLLKSEEINSEKSVYPVKILLIGVADYGIRILDRYRAQENNFVSLLGIQEGIFPDGNRDYEIIRIDRKDDALEEQWSGLADMEGIEGLKARMSSSDMVFIIFCLRDKCAFDLAYKISKISRELDILTGGIVLKLPSCKSDNILQDMRNEILNIERMVNYLISFRFDSFLGKPDSNDVTNSVVQKSAGFISDMVDIISDMVNLPSVINIDFEDIMKVLKNGGKTFVGIGKGEGEEKAYNAVREASSMDYTEGIIKEAKKVLLCISGNISILDLNKATDYIISLNIEKPEVVVAVRQEGELNDDITAMIIAC